MIAVVADAGLAERAELPCKAVGGCKRRRPQAASPIRPGVAEVKGHTLGVILDPEIVGDGSHHGMADILIHFRIVIIPDVPAPVRGAVDPAVEPFAVPGFVAIPIPGVKIARA